MNVESTKILLISGANHNSVGCDEQQLRFVHDHFGRWLTHLELGAYFWIWAACSVSCAARTLIPSCCCAPVACSLAFPGAENGEGQSGDYSPGGYRFQSAFEINGAECSPLSSCEKRIGFIAAWAREMAK
jgi:hypothetical protein